MASKINTKLGDASGFVTALNGAVAIECARSDGVVVAISATAVTATITMEVSFDSSDGIDGIWYTIACSPSNSTNLYTQVATIALTAMPTIFWTVRTFGAKWMRARASAFTSATALRVSLSEHIAEL